MKYIYVGLLLWSSLVGQANAVDVYILSGQSNMDGYGSTAELPDSLKSVIQGAYIWSGSDFIELDPMSNSEFGPEVAFAWTYLNLVPGRDIYLVKQAVGGIPLHPGWDSYIWKGLPPGPGRDNYYPGISLNDPNIGNQYRQLSDVFLAALQKLDDDNIPHVIKGVVWMQGEADAKGEESATAYASYLKIFSDRIHEDLGIPGTIVPLVYGQVLPYEPTADRFTHRVETRQSQANADRDSGHQDSFENAYMVSTDDASLLEDHVHYDTEGQLMIGTAFAEEMILGQRAAICLPDDEFEDNDSTSTATLLTAGLQIAGIVCPDDQDWFGISVAVGEVISATMKFNHADGDIDMTLYDPAGIPVDSANSENDNEMITHTAIQSGIYKLEVTGVSVAKNRYLLAITPRSQLMFGNSFETD
ncbi:MAG: sialate O-acetylesterase [Lysobacterales bacterium]